MRNYFPRKSQEQQQQQASDRLEKFAEIFLWVITRLMVLAYAYFAFRFAQYLLGAMGYVYEFGDFKPWFGY